MGKIRFWLEGRECWYECSPEEFIELVRKGKASVDTPPSERRVNGLPSVQAIAKYIEAKGGNMRHKMPELTVHFLGRRIVWKSEGRIYDRFYRRLVMAQRHLERKHTGTFETTTEPERDGKVNRAYRVYTFKPAEPG